MRPNSYIHPQGSTLQVLAITDEVILPVIRWDPRRSIDK